MTYYEETIEDETIATTLGWLKFKPDDTVDREHKNYSIWIYRAPSVEDMANAIKYQAEIIEAYEKKLAVYAVRGN